MTKRCRRCTESKPVACFARNHKCKDGLVSICKPCHQDYVRERKYGLTPEEYTALVEAQGGCCPICRRVFSESRDIRRSPHVDHDHVTDRVRGVLCHRCNTGIGLLGESPAVLAAAIQYLTS